MVRNSTQGFSTLFRRIQRAAADAIKCGKGKVKGPFLVIYGDLFFHPDVIQKLLSAFRNCDGVFTAREVTNPERFGVLVIDGEFVRKIIEKPKTFISNLINSGIYIMPEKIFDAIEKT